MTRFDAECHGRLLKALRIFSQQNAKSRVADVGVSIRLVSDPPHFENSRSTSLASSLPEQEQSKPVFRVSVFSIVLVLAGSPTSAFFCTMWCESPGTGATATEACQHHTVPATASVAGGDTCERFVLASVAFVREESERLVSSSAARDGILASGHESGRVTAGNHAVVNHSVARLFTKAPASPVLRI